MKLGLAPPAACSCNAGIGAVPHQDRFVRNVLFGFLSVFCSWGAFRLGRPSPVAQRNQKAKRNPRNKINKPGARSRAASSASPTARRSWRSSAAASRRAVRAEVLRACVEVQRGALGEGGSFAGPRPAHSEDRGGKGQGAACSGAWGFRKTPRPGPLPSRTSHEDMKRKLRNKTVLIRF